MSGPAFGFSVGDFISAINLVKTLIKALNDATGSKLQYKLLIEALLNVERALTEVKALQVIACQASQKIALEQVAVQCEQSIERFLAKNEKFKGTLGNEAIQGKKWRWKSGLHKVEWAMFRDEAIAELRAEITGHTLTLNTLLATIQLSSTFLQNETVKEHEVISRDHVNVSEDTNTLARRNSALLTTQADLIHSISRQVVKCASRDQTADLQTIMPKVMDTNMKIYTIVLDMQKIQQSIPPQVDRQQPILFEDAHGRIAPFHVEFINSFEAFQAVMEVRFQHVPGLRKVRNKEYTVQDPHSRRKLNLTAPWESVFSPGRKFNMSMTFHRPQNSASSCPGCQTENMVEGEHEDAEIQCLNPRCNIWYQRVVEIHTAVEAVQQPTPTITSILQSLGKMKIQEEIDDDTDDDDDQIQHFRPVQVIHQCFLERSSSSIISNIQNNIPTPKCHCGYIPKCQPKWHAFNLRRHMRTQHGTPVRIYHCEVNGCNSGFARRNDFRIHQKERHKDYQATHAENTFNENLGEHDGLGDIKGAELSADLEDPLAAVERNPFLDSPSYSQAFLNLISPSNHNDSPEYKENFDAFLFPGDTSDQFSFWYPLFPEQKRKIVFEAVKFSSIRRPLRPQVFDKSSHIESGDETPENGSQKSAEMTTTHVGRISAEERLIEQNDSLRALINSSIRMQQDLISVTEKGISGQEGSLKMRQSEYAE